MMMHGDWQLLLATVLFCLHFAFALLLYATHTATPTKAIEEEPPANALQLAIGSKNASSINQTHFSFLLLLLCVV
jgi:hypothetical protein